VVFEYTCVESRMARNTSPLTVDPSCGNVRSDSWHFMTVVVMCFTHFNCYLTLAQFAYGKEVIFLYLIPSLSQVFAISMSLCLCSLISKCMN
jgi:hypothetical protein